MDFLSSLQPPTWLMEGYLSPTYDVMFGDTPTFVFVTEYIPIMYVTVLPLLNVFIKLFCVCNPSALGAFRWPPPDQDLIGSRRGQRIVRRVLAASAGISRMATAAALTAARSNKSSKNKTRTQAALTAQMAGQYGNSPAGSKRAENV